MLGFAMQVSRLTPLPHIVNHLDTLEQNLRLALGLVRCKSFLIRNVTIIAACDSPDTDRINQVRIQVQGFVWTARGSGGYVKDIYISNANFAIGIRRFYGEHPDANYDSKTLPDVEKKVIDNVVARNVMRAGNFQGIEELPF
ncbi:hypothetical protein L7F22_002675 [Adiantum nelumboides]|nr:hypothetical protein [Adiantum nelumboides]